MNDVSLDELTPEAWSSLLNTRFSVRDASSRVVELELVGVVRSPAGALAGAGKPGARTESFGLLFEGPRDRPLEQKTYHFEHERLGRFELFIVPIEPREGASRYEAIFNRLARQPATGADHRDRHPGV